MRARTKVQGSVKYKVLPNDVPNENNDDDCTEDEDEEITIDFNAPFINQQRRKKRTICIRVMVSVILLGIVFGFMFYEWNEYWPEVGEHQDNDDTSDEDHEHHQDQHHDDEHKGHPHNHSQSLFHNAAVITDSAICSGIGKALLQDGGNVVDAGIAALLCLGVVHPHVTGVGGVFSAILYNHSTKSFKAIRDSSQKLPAYGAPSLLQGLHLLHSNYGRLQWSQLFKNATKLAKDGFLIDAVLSKALETHKDKILQSGLCDLFCNTTVRVKSEGEHVTNGNLSELLLSVSLNGTYFPEKLAVKLSQDISEEERPAFLAAAKAGGGEINEPLITVKEKYSILSAPSQLTGGMVSSILDRVREQNLTFLGHGDLGNASGSYNSLLNLANEFFNTSQREIFTLNTTSSHVGALDSHGNFIVISTSLNSTWGSGRYLRSSGVILNDFTSNMTQMPYFSFPLVINVTGDEEEDMQFVAVTGGPSALLHSVVMLKNLVDDGRPARETVSSPVLHLEQDRPGTLCGCLSAITNGSVVYRLLSEGDGQVHNGECSGHFPSLLLELKAGHVGAYGDYEIHSDGY